MKLQRIGIANSTMLALTFLRDSYLVSQEAAGCTAKTLTNIKTAFKVFLAFAKDQGIATVDQIDANTMRAFILAERTRGQQDRSVQTYLIIMQAFFRWCIDEEHLDSNPMEKVKMPRVEKKIIEAFSDAEIKKLMNVTAGSDPDVARDRAIVACLLDSGLRAAEFVNMKVGSVDLQTGLFVVLGKGRKQRHVRLGANARKALIKYLQVRNGKEGQPLWIGVRGPITTNGLLQITSAIGKACGVSPCNPHKFRRTFALNCLRNGMDPFSLQILMGHSDLQILRQYLAQTRADVQKAHEQCSPMDRLMERKSA